MGYKIPDYIGRVAGFRKWMLHYIPAEQKIYFSALYLSVEDDTKSSWVIGDNKFECFCSRGEDGANALAGLASVYKHKEIVEGGECGFYAMNTFKGLGQVGWLETTTRSKPEHRMFGIPGISSHWGKILKGPNGLRSEYARIEAIAEHTTYPWQTSPQKDKHRKVIEEMRALIEDMSIPIIKNNEIDSFIEERGLIPAWQI